MTPESAPVGCRAAWMDGPPKLSSPPARWGRLDGEKRWVDFALGLLGVGRRGRQELFDSAVGRVDAGAYADVHARETPVSQERAPEGAGEGLHINGRQPPAIGDRHGQFDFEQVAAPGDAINGRIDRQQAVVTLAGRQLGARYHITDNDIGQRRPDDNRGVRRGEELLDDGVAFVRDSGGGDADGQCES